MQEAILEFDKTLFLLINSHHDRIVDFIMYYASYKFTWIPFYIWLLYVLYRNYGKKTLWLLPVVAALIVGSDQISVLIKDAVERLRPCNNP